MSNIVWSKMQCHFCDMAKRLLEQKEIVYEEYQIKKLALFTFSKLEH